MTRTRFSSSATAARAMRLLTVLLLVLSASTARAQQAYEVFLPANGIAPVSAASITFGNITSGELPGLVVSGLLGGRSLTTRIYTAQGEEAITSPNDQVRYRLSFSALPIPLPQVYLGDVLSADLSNAQREELVILGAQQLEEPFNVTGVVFRNTNGGITPGAPLPGLYNAKAASTGDLLAISGTTGSQPVLRVYRYFVAPSPPGGSEAAQIADLPGLELAALDLATDGQGNHVLVASGLGSDGVPVGRVYRQVVGAAGFAEIPNAGVPALYNGAAKLADLNSDGLLDLLITGSTYGPQFVEGVSLLLFGTADGSFRPSGLSLPRLAGSVADVADRDGDGDLDLLLAGLEGSPLEGRGAYYVYDNDGLGGFSLFATGAAPYGGDGGWADLNGNGELDFAIGGTLFGADALQFYRGQGGGEQ
jgi:hypothetical protein